MSEQAVNIPHGDGWLAADINRNGDQAVIFLPGWSGTRYGPQRILLQAAEACAKQGLTTLRLDYGGRGDSSEVNEVTLDGMISDAMAAITWLREKYKVQQISLVGLCSGGNVALGVASLDENITNVICWSLLPFMEDKQKATHQGTPRQAILAQYLRKIFTLQTWRKLFSGELNVKGAQDSLVKDKEGDQEEQQHKTSKRLIMSALVGYCGKVFLIYGSRDPEAIGARSFYTTWFKQHKIEVVAHTVEDAPHNFYTAGWTAAVIRQTVHWLAD